jgi:hypothetical protein
MRKERTQKMELGRILGLPAHPLFVHAVVVLVPLCAIGVVLCALWLAARRRLSLAVLVLSVFAAAMVPLPNRVASGWSTR